MHIQAKLYDPESPALHLSCSRTLQLRRCQPGRINACPWDMLALTKLYIMKHVFTSNISACVITNTVKWTYEEQWQMSTGNRAWQDRPSYWTLFRRRLIAVFEGLDDVTHGRHFHHDKVHFIPLKRCNRAKLGVLKSGLLLLHRDCCRIKQLLPQRAKRT